ncbi:thioredoxin family protein [Pseudoneobacillus sp. C159]
MKKMLVFIGVIVALFVALAVVNNLQNNQKVEGNNPYKTKKLKQSTIDQLNDPNYQNIILPEDLEKKLANKEDLTVYFFSPECSHCKVATPILMPLADEMSIHIDQYNILEFEQGWDQYRIDGTPTLVRYKDGKEVARIDGARDAAQYRQWLEQYVKK